MALEARTLTAGELLPILGEVFRGHVTGTLVLQQGSVSKFLYAEEGQFIFAASNASEDKFTEILIEKGKLTADQLAMAMEKKGNRTIGRTLVELGFLGSSDLLEALVEQMRRIAVSAANWEEGQAVFKPGVLPPNLAKLPVVTPRFILDVALSVEDREWAARLLGDMEYVPVLTTEGRAASPSLRLTPAEQKILSAVDGRRKAREVADTAGSDPFTASRFLLGLNALGYLEIAPAEAEEAPEEPKIDLNFLDISSPEAPEVPGPTPAALPPSPKVTAPLPFEAEPARSGEAGPGKEPQEEGEALPASLPGMAPPPPPIRVQPGTSPRPPAPSFRPIRVDAGVSRPELLFPDGEGAPEAERPEGGERPPRRFPDLRRVLLGTAAALVVLAVAGLSLWYFFLRPSKFVPLEPAAPAAAKPAVTAPAAPAPEPEAGPPPSPPEAAVPSLPERPPEAGPQTPFPQEAPAAAAEPPSPAPPPPSAPAAPSDLSAARRLLEAGRYEEAARAFADALRGREASFTVDVEVACQAETIAKGLRASASDERFMVLPYNLKGRSCFRVIWGLYADRPSAEAGLKDLPEFFHQNASPRVSTWKRP